MLSQPTRVQQAVIAASLILALASCGGSAGRVVQHAGVPKPVTNGSGHDCVVPGGSSPAIDWTELHNPILSSASAGEKDEAIVWFAGKWHMLFSYVRYDARSLGGVYWDIATSTSTDLVHWAAPIPWPTQSGTLGVASPEVAREPN